jgi:SAM-dependent methyltransferase
LATWHNATGRPLASDDWLEAHHRAKLRERTIFARSLTGLQPARIVDLGCATGLWLQIFNELLPETCDFIGLDTDPDALALARQRAANWKRQVSFEECDFELDADSIPASDLTLAFNVFSYIEDLPLFLDRLASRLPRGAVAIRQYDGAGLRFGPMDTATRQSIEVSLRAAVEPSAQFRHYDMDRVYAAIARTRFKQRAVTFETFARTSPFPDDFLDYYRGTMNWTLQHLSIDAAELLECWLSEESDDFGPPRYFVEVDLTAVLS